jgi:hypothetical protein
MKNKSIYLITFAILANLFLANFASAQTLPANPLPGLNQNQANVILDANALRSAQTDPDACRTFRKLVQQVYPGTAKAIWDAEMAPPDDFNKKGYCAVVPAAYADYLDADLTKPSGIDPLGLYGQANAIPPEFTNIEVQIRQGKGITSATVAKAEAQYEQDQINAGASGASNFIGRMIASLLDVTAALLGLIMATAGSIFNSAVSNIINVTTLPQVVIIGWTIIRDICDMFFILAMIVIAVAAILRIEKYDYRHLLREVVINALLLNFSLVIALTILNAVNFLAAVFYSNGLGVDIFKTMLTIVNPVNDFGTIQQGGWQAALVLGLGKNLFMLVGTCVFVALAGMFVIRLVGLYVLIIFSPIAYVARILPSTEKFSEEWWEKFIKYLIWAPVSLFMIRLTILVVHGVGQNTTIVGNGVLGNSGFGSNFTGTSGNDSSFYYFILCAFLAAAFLVAEEAGMVGSKQFISMAEKAGHWASHTAFEMGDRKLASWATSGNRFKRALSYGSIGAWKKGREMSIHHKEEEAYTEAAGIRADQYGKVFGGPGDFGRLSQYQRLAQEKKRFENIVDKAEIVAQVKEAFEHGHYDKAVGGMLRLAAQGDINEIPLALDDPDAPRDAAGNLIGRKSYVSSGEGLKKVLMDTIGKEKGEDYAMRMAADIGKVAEQQEQYLYSGVGKFNEVTGKYDSRTEPDRQDYATIQRSKSNMQGRVRNLGRLDAFEEYISVDNRQVSTGPVDMSFLKSIGPDQMQEDERMGNASRHANIVINGSQRVMREAPLSWVTAAQQLADAVVKEDVTEIERIRIAAVSEPENYDVQTMKPSHAAEFFRSNPSYVGQAKYSSLERFSRLDDNEPILINLMSPTERTRRGVTPPPPTPPAPAPVPPGPAPTP